MGNQPLSFPCLRSALQTLEGDDQLSYRTFALGVVDRLKAKSGEWLNERSVRELAYWNALKEELGRGGAQ